MSLPHHDSTTAFGTLTGTALSVLASIQSQDLLKTVILAVVGASVSFIMSLLLKWVKKKFWE